MYIYIWIYTTTFILCINGIITQKKTSYTLLTTFIMLITALRFDTGFDYYWYWMVGDKSYSQTYHYKYMYDKIEIVFKKIYDISRYLDRPQLFFIVTSFVTFLLIFKYIKSNSKLPYLSASYFIFTTYYFRFSLFFIRQSLAIAIVTYFVYLILNKKKKAYFGVVLITTVCVHSSAIIALVFLLLDKKKLKIKNLLLVSVGVIFMKKLIPLLLLRLPLLNKYLYLFNKESGSLLGNRALLFMFILVILIMIYEKKYIGKFTKDYILFRNIYTIGVFIYLVLKISFGGHTAYRVAWYFLIHSVVLLSYMCFSLKNKKITQIILILLLFIKANFEILKETTKNEDRVKKEGNIYRRDDLYYFWINKKEFHLKQLPGV